MGIPLGKAFDILDTPLIIRYKGLLDFDGMYKMMHAWLISKRYVFHEESYKDKVDTTKGNELQIKWKGEKKVSEFVKEYIEIEFHLWDFLEVEVIKDGRKIKMHKARMEIIFKPKLELDYSQRFSKGSDFSKKLGEFYVEKIIYWDWRIKYYNALEYSVYDLHTKVKKYLNMYTSLSVY